MTTWKIASFSAERNEGTIVSPHLGPLAFGARQNVSLVADFTEGEAVLVEVSGRPPELVVEKLWPARARQPSDTEDPVFAEVRRNDDAAIIEQTKTSLRIWSGNCCGWCAPFAYITFHDATVVWPVEEPDLDQPLFRRASAGEIATLSVPVPEGYRVYCIVTSHGNGADGPSAFVVARDVEITHHARTP